MFSSIFSRTAFSIRSTERETIVLTSVRHMKLQIRLTTVDIVAIGINLFLAAAHFAFGGSGANALIGLAFLAANGVVIGFAAADARGLLQPGTVAHFLRLFYVQLFYAFYFTRIIVLSQLVWSGASFDALFYRMEEAIFGVQLAVLLPERFGHLRAVNELFYFAYFSYYVLLCVPGWLLYLRRRYREAERALFIITASFALLYVWYVFFPVHGPKYFIAELCARWYSDLDGYLFAWIMRSIFADANLAGAAVPSSHVAISCIATVLHARHFPRTLVWQLPLTILLWISTVYLYAHYAVDALLGLAVVPALLWYAGKLSAALERRMPERVG